MIKKQPFQLRFEASGRGLPVGHTGRKYGAEVSVTGKLVSPAVTPLAGTPPTPVTVRSREPPGPRGDEKPTVPSRVARIRAGESGVLPVPVAGPWEYQPMTSATTAVLPE